MRWLWFIAWSLAAAASAADLGIRVDATSPWTDPQGYTPVHISIHSPKSGSMRLRVEGSSTNASTVVPIPANQPVQVNLLLPPSLGDHYFYARLNWELVGVINGQADISRSGHDEDTRFILVNDTDNVNELENAIRSFSSSRVINRVEPEHLPDRWQGYPDWTALIITPSGQAKLSDAQRTAIQQWALTGGVVIVSTIALENAWRQLGVTAQVVPLTEFKKNGDKNRDFLEGLANKHNNHEQFQPQNSPVPGTEFVPVTLFIITALGFALLVGPLNLWWVRRRGSRTLFLVTTPLLSFAACVVLLVASLLSDGVSTKRSAVQLVLLNPSTQQALTFTGASYFAAFATNQLNLDHSSKFSPMSTDDRSYRYRRYRRDDKNNFTIQWEEGQKISGSVIPAREHRQLGFTEVKPERRRVIIERTGQGWQVRNGLGVTMTNFGWVDQEGIPWTCDEIPDGLAVPLKSVPKGNKGYPLPSLSRKLINRMPRATRKLTEEIELKHFFFTAELAKPLDPIPGPSATDVEPPIAHIAGILQPEEATP